ncbi:hypothetical protein [Sinorhizobium fredii]|uniref:hypothetical protein n=1 Tax=Rhizobium fredii TaxID=380 RepID=UPI0004B84DFF|nr:hypothetical protein [Sinorhizobium fredii]
MAIGTPTQLVAAGATATNATSASFTPSANVRMFALCAGRGASAEAPTLTDSLSGTWTEITGSSVDAGNIWGRIFYQDVGGSPAAMTVTVSSTGATQAAVEVFEISGSGAISSNFQSNVNAAGDPSVTMSAYAGTSIAVAMGVGNAGSTWTQPTGFTEIYDLAPATNVRLNVSYDMASPATSLSWSSTSTDSIGYGLEITEAAAGGISGSASITEAGDTVSSASVLALRASLAATEASDSITATASVRIAAAASLTESSDTLSATATIAAASRTGSASITEAGDTLASAAALALKASASITESGDTLSTVAALALKGIASITEAGDTVSASAVPVLVSSPAERTATVLEQDRTATVPAEIRFASVKAETRSASVRSETRLAAA